MDPEKREKKTPKKRERESVPKEVEEIEEKFHAEKGTVQKKSTATKKSCSDVDVIPVKYSACCHGPKVFCNSLLQENHSLLPLGSMFRMIFEQLALSFTPLPDQSDDPGIRLMCMAYDISLLWFNATEQLGSCSAFKLDIDMCFMLYSWKTERPKPMSVASCHPTAENLANLLKAPEKNAIQRKGTLGAGQSKKYNFTTHNQTCKALTTSLRNAARGIWWVSHCGHSFCLIKRDCFVGIEVIDSFANNRGLGYWALTPEEGKLVEPAIPKNWSDDQDENWNFHIAPEKRIWSIEEMVELVQKLVNKKLDTRYEAQSSLVNYYYETPDDKTAEGDFADDQLPYGAFGFVQYDLCPDQQILTILAQKFFHGYEKLTFAHNSRLDLIKQQLMSQGVTEEKFNELFPKK